MLMENPKIRIESDGLVTEVYFEGEKIEKACLADFVFHAEPMQVVCEVEKIKLDENGEIIFDGDEVVKEKLSLITFKGEKNDRTRN